MCTSGRYHIAHDNIGNSFAFCVKYIGNIQTNWNVKDKHDLITIKSLVLNI